jgi:hypothetical protein
VRVLTSRPVPAPGAQAGPLSASPTRLQIRPMTAPRQVLSDAIFAASVRHKEALSLQMDDWRRAARARPTRSPACSPIMVTPTTGRVAAAQKRHSQAPCAPAAFSQEEADKRVVASQLEGLRAELSEARSRETNTTGKSKSKGEGEGTPRTECLCSLGSCHHHHH